MRKVTITFTKGNEVVMETVLSFEADYDGVSITGEMQVVDDDMADDEDGDDRCCYDEDGDVDCRHCSNYRKCNGCYDPCGSGCEECPDYETCPGSPAYNS